MSEHAPRQSGLTTEEELIERFAALSHEQWSGWARWMIVKWGSYADHDESYIVRWGRQADTPYAMLSEAEKESDRIEARKWLSLLRSEWEASR